MVAFLAFVVFMAVRIVDGRQMYVRKTGEPYGPAPLPYRQGPGSKAP